MRGFMLICPKCKKELMKQDHMFSCIERHCFDIAKRGYVNLLLGNQHATGDDKEMVKARTRFLSHGYYQPLCDELIQIIKKMNIKCMIDAGCGEGYYTNAICKETNISEIYGFDLSKHAVDEACKAKQPIQYGVANVFHMPVADKCADLITSIFAPFNSMEIKRILKIGGRFIQVGPAKQHLYELKEILYQNVYENEGLEINHDDFHCCHKQTITYTIELDDKDDIWALFQMTPYYWKTPKEGSDRLRNMPSIHTTVSFEILVFERIA